MKKKSSIRKFVTNSAFVALLAATSLSPAVSAQSPEEEVYPLAIEMSYAEDVIPYEYLILFKEGVSEQEMRETLANYKVIKEHYASKLATVQLTKSEFNRLKNVLSIEIIEPNAEVEAVGVATPYQYAHENTNVQTAWAQNLKGKGIKIAVIDSGIAAHSDLNIAGGVSMVNYTDSYSDDYGHGTHVAGIIGALDNGEGVTGVASEAEIYSVKVLQHTNTGTLIDIVAGFNWAIEQNVDIINANLGTNYNSAALKQSIDKAEAKGIIVVASGGNTGGASKYPALYDNVVAVSASNEQNNLADFSSRGANIDLAAPGEHIISTYLNGGYAKLSGTSMAAPYVAGMLALYKEAYPNKTAQQIVELAYENALDLGLPGQDHLFGHGLIRFPEMANVQDPSSINPLLSADNQKIYWDEFATSNRYQVKMEVMLENGEYEQYRFIRSVGSEEFDLTLLEQGHKYRLSITPYNNDAYDYSKTKYVYVSLEDVLPFISETEFPKEVAPVEPPVEEPTPEPTPIPETAIQLDAANNKIFWEKFEQSSYYLVKMEQKQTDGTYTKFGSDRQTMRTDYDLKSLVNGYTYRVSVLPRTADRQYSAEKAITAYIRVDDNGNKTLSAQDQFGSQPEVPSVVEKPKEELPAPLPSTKEIYLTEGKQLVWTAVPEAKRYRVELKQKNEAGEFVKYSFNRNVSVAQFDTTVLPQGFEYYLTIVPYINYAYDYNQAYKVYVDTATNTLKVD